MRVLIIRNVERTMVPVYLFVAPQVGSSIFDDLLIPIANHVVGFGHVKAVDNFHDPYVEVM